MNFGERIKQLRQNKCYTQRKLAELLHVDHTYLSKIENNRIDYIPKEDLIRNIANKLDADGDELVFLAGKIPMKYSGLLSQLVVKYGDRLPELLEQLSKMDNPLIREIRAVRQL